MLFFKNIFLLVVSYSIVMYSLSPSYGTYFILFCIKPGEGK